MIDQNKFGLFIVELRKERGLTQEELAAMLFVGREAVSKWERGVGLPSHTVLLKLSEVLGVTINELLYGARETKENKEEIETVTLKWIDKITNKLTKWKIIFIVTILLAVIIYFISYFIYNYNSINVYTTYASGNNYTIEQGLILTCKNKMYFQLGNIKNLTDSEIEKVRIYYKYKDKEIELISGDELTDVVIDLKEYKKLTDESSVKNIIQNLYISINNGKDEDTYELQVKLDFVNSYILNNEEKYEVDIERATTLESNNIDVDKIKSKFKLKNGEYIYYFKYEGKKYKCTLLNEIVIVEFDDLFIHYKLYPYEATINYNTSAVYNYKESRCELGDCTSFEKVVQALTIDLTT